MAKQLNVPLHLQKPDSEDCGPMSSLMILDYFDIPSTEQEIINKVPKCNDGTDAFGNANTLMEYGLKVKIVTKSPLLFTGDFLRTVPTKQAIVSHVQSVQDTEENSDKKAILSRLIKFLDNGGEIMLEQPLEKHILATIDEDGLVFAGIYGHVLGKNEGKYHFVVVGGYDKNEFLIYNPWPRSRQKSWEDKKDFIFAIHTSTLFDYDNGSILLVTKS